MREKFYFFGSFRDTAKAIQDPQLRLAYLEAVMDYWIAGIDPPDPIIQALLIQTKFTIDRSVEISSSASIRGKKWWAPQGNKNACKNWWKQSKQAKSSKNNLTQAKTSEEEVEVEEEREVEEENNKKIITKPNGFEIKNPEETFWNSDINDLIEELKLTAKKIGIAYDKREERKFWKHICSAREFWDFAKKIGQTRLEFARNILLASVAIKFWKGACSWPKAIYQNYVEVYNLTLNIKQKQAKSSIKSFSSWQSQ